MTTTHRTLCAIDFSAASLAALDFACVLARKEPEASVTMMHAMALPTMQLAAADVVVAQDVEQRIRADLDAAMRALVETHRDARVQVDGRVVRGAAASMLTDEARSTGVRRIVLGGNGRSALPRWLLGSVADRVLRTSSVDVVVVPKPTADAPARGAIRHVLCATDFSAASEMALLRATELARAHDATLHVVHAWTVAPYVDRIPELRQSIARDLERALDATVFRHESPGIRVERHLVSGHVATAIVERAKALDADVIVVGTGGKDVTDRFFLGSVSERVVRTATVPVLVAHASRND